MDEAEVSFSVRNEEEDLSWADSCINNSPDDSEDWGTFRDALTEILDIHPEIFVPSSTLLTRRSVLSPPPDEEMTETKTETEPSFEPEANSSNEEVSEIVSLLTFESDPSKNSLQDHYFIESNGTRESVLDNATTDLEEDGLVSNGDVAEEEVPEPLLSQVFKEEFMSSAVSIQDNVVEEDGFDNVSEDLLSVKVTSPQEIFKVWDLEIDDDEEDVLVLQLKKALDESSTTIQPLPQPLNDVAVDDLIAGISDLSLTETF